MNPNFTLRAYHRLMSRVLRDEHACHLSRIIDSCHRYCALKNKTPYVDYGLFCASHSDNLVHIIISCACMLMHNFVWYTVRGGNNHEQIRTNHQEYSTRRQSCETGSGILHRLTHQTDGKPRQTRDARHRHCGHHGKCTHGQSQKTHDHCHVFR